MTERERLYKEFGLVLPEERQIITPQQGYQTQFAQSNATVAIGGAAAGVGKTFSLLMEPLYNADNPFFRGITFRRLRTEVRRDGGLWDEAKELYRIYGGAENDTYLRWTFPSLSRCRFDHLQYEKTKEEHKGGQYTFVGFDELTSFSRKQFFYLLSRNRSHKATLFNGVLPYCRATTNPQGIGWVKDLIKFWVYPDDHEIEALQGYPIPNRQGMLRYYTRYKNRMIWGDTPEEVLSQARWLKEDAKKKNVDPLKLVKSMTFIAGNITDNTALLSADAGYLAHLHSLDEDEKRMLLHGSWKFGADDDLLLRYPPVMSMFSNSFIPWEQEENFITADIALDGADNFVLGVWQGLRLHHVKVVPKSDGDEVVDIIRELCARFGVPVSNVCYDADGVGRFLKGFLKGAVPFDNAGAPLPTLGANPKTRIRYKNARAQMYYKLRDVINKYLLWVDLSSGKLKEELREELLAFRKKNDSEGKKGVSSREDVKGIIGRSPDLATMVMLRMRFFFPRPNPKGRVRSF